MRDITDDLRVADPNGFGVMPPHQFHKQLLQRMRFGIHVQGPLQPPHLDRPSDVSFGTIRYRESNSNASNFCFVNHPMYLDASGEEVVIPAVCWPKVALAASCVGGSGVISCAICI